MRMRRILPLLVLLLTLPALAQDRPRPAQQDRQRARGERGPRGEGGPGPMFDRIAQRLTDELELNEAQQAQLDKIIQTYRDRGRPDPGLMGEFLDSVSSILDANQAKKLADFRERMGRFGPPGGGPGMGRLLQDLPERLNLDDQQKAEFDRLVAEMREQGASMRERWQELRPLMEEMRAARRAGDTERVEEIRQQLEEARGQAGPPFESFFAQLETILRPDQKAILADIRAQFAQGRGRGAAGAGNIRSVLQAVQQLDLDAKQRQKVRQLGDEARRAARDLRSDDVEGQATLAAALKKQILAELKPQQAREFERLLQSDRPQRQRAGRPRAVEPADSGTPEVQPTTEQP